MRCYMVKADGCVRLAASGGEARAFRQAMVEDRDGLKKKDVEITPVEIGSAKPIMLAAFNGLLEALDDNTDFEMPDEIKPIDKEAKKAAIEARKAAKTPAPAKKSAPTTKKPAPVKPAAKKPAPKKR